jgi:3-hydroxymyristoyl/3-hydroxydecanoyl-(acyl carrier protein) dehydratase
LAALPEILAERGEAHGVSVDLHVPAALPQFRGHFDTAPILAGIVQIDWALQLARKHGLADGEAHYLAGIKFQKTIRPQARLNLHLQMDTARGELKFLYQALGGGSAYSTGRIGFGAH